MTQQYTDKIMALADAYVDRYGDPDARAALLAAVTEHDEALRVAQAEFTDEMAAHKKACDGWAESIERNKALQAKLDAAHPPSQVNQKLVEAWAKEFETMGGFKDGYHCAARLRALAAAQEAQ